MNWLEPKTSETGQTHLPFDHNQEFCGWSGPLPPGTLEEQLVRLLAEYLPLRIIELEELTDG